MFSSCEATILDHTHEARIYSGHRRAKLVKLIDRRNITLWKEYGELSAVTVISDIYRLARFTGKIENRHDEFKLHVGSPFPSTSLIKISFYGTSQDRKDAFAKMESLRPAKCSPKMPHRSWLLKEHECRFGE